MDEIWKPIIINGIDSGYQISSLKRVKNKKNNIIKIGKRGFGVYLSGKRIGCSVNNLYNLNFTVNEYFYYMENNKIYLNDYEIDKLEWTPMDGFPDYYISVYGIIKSLKNNKVYYICREPHKCNGYVYITLRKDKKRITFRLHKLVMMVYSTKTVQTHIINHINGHKQDNRLINLEYCSESDNALHAVSMGLVSKRARFRKPDNRIIDGEIWRGALFYTKDMLLIDFTLSYEVSDFGRIRNINGKIHLGKVTKDNYNIVTLRKYGRVYCVSIHRVVASTFIVNIDMNNNIVDHVNRDRMDNNVSNLRWYTSKLNASNKTKK